MIQSRERYKVLQAAWRLAMASEPLGHLKTLFAPLVATL
jgi:hypothetical protein